jgi:hypothetical protein
LKSKDYKQERKAATSPIYSTNNASEDSERAMHGKISSSITARAHGVGYDLKNKR